MECKSSNAMAAMMEPMKAEKVKGCRARQEPVIHQHLQTIANLNIFNLIIIINVDYMIS